MPVLKMPDRLAIGQVRGIQQAAETLIAVAIQKLVFHLFIRKIVQAFQDQDPHHDFGGVRRATTLGTHRSRSRTIYLRCQCREIDAGANYASSVDLITK